MDIYQKKIWFVQKSCTNSNKHVPASLTSKVKKSLANSSRETLRQNLSESNRTSKVKVLLTLQLL